MKPRTGSLVLFACAAVSSLGIGFVTRALDDFRPEDFRPGLGYPPEQHTSTIEDGMTKDEVFSLLGHPHQPRDIDFEDEWTYRCDFFGGTSFRVYFGLDDRVTRREWWLN